MKDLYGEQIKSADRVIQVMGKLPKGKIPRRMAAVVPAQVSSLDPKSCTVNPQICSVKPQSHHPSQSLCRRLPPQMAAVVPAQVKSSELDVIPALPARTAEQGTTSAPNVPSRFRWSPMPPDPIPPNLWSSLHRLWSRWSPHR